MHDQYRGTHVDSGISCDPRKFPLLKRTAIGEIMSTDQVHFERRASQRFDFQLPVGVRLAGTDREGCGFTQDLSGRGAFFYTDFQVSGRRRSGTDFRDARRKSR